MINLVLLAIGGLAIWAASRHIKANRRPTGDEYDAAELADAIHKLCELSGQLTTADRMLADLEACSPRSLLRGFRVNWCGIDGKSRMLDFWATGDNRATAGLREAAQESRDQVNAEIIALVRAMAAALDSGEAPAISLDAVENTVDETTAAGEW